MYVSLFDDEEKVKKKRERSRCGRKNKISYISLRRNGFVDTGLYNLSDPVKYGGITKAHVGKGNAYNGNKSHRFRKNAQFI